MPAGTARVKTIEGQYLCQTYNRAGASGFDRSQRCAHTAHTLKFSELSMFLKVLSATIIATHDPDAERIPLVLDNLAR